MSAFKPSHIQTDHFTSHSALLPVYEKLFEPIKDTKDSVLEIGTNDGGGLMMYSGFFHRAKCFGMDILPTPAALPNDGKIFHCQRDAYTKESVELMGKLGGKFALIVDDGPHTLSSQIWFCVNYPDLLSPDGIAIVEDIQEDRFTDPIAQAVPKGFHSMVVCLRHVNNRYDDLISVIWRA